MIEVFQNGDRNRDVWLGMEVHGTNNYLNPLFEYKKNTIFSIRLAILETSVGDGLMQSSFTTYQSIGQYLLKNLSIVHRCVIVLFNALIYKRILFSLYAVSCCQEKVTAEVFLGVVMRYDMLGTNISFQKKKKTFQKHLCFRESGVKFSYDFDAHFNIRGHFKSIFFF